MSERFKPYQISISLSPSALTATLSTSSSPKKLIFRQKTEEKRESLLSTDHRLCPSLQPPTLRLWSSAVTF